jgi:hypothetical protein
MATLAEARKAALEPGGGGFYRRAKWVVGSQINAYNHTWPRTGEPALIRVWELVRDDWITCSEDGTPTSPAQAAPPAETAPPDTGALWEQAVEAEKADYFNHGTENVWDVLESVKDRVAVLKAERDKSTETE